MVKGFFNEVDGTLFQGVDGHLHVAVGRENDDRKVCLAGNEVFLDFQSAHAAHAHIKQQHGNGLRIVLCDKAFAAVENLHLVVAGFQKPAHGIADGLIVVDNVNSAQRLLRLGEVIRESHKSNSWNNSNRSCFLLYRTEGLRVRVSFY